MVKADDYVDVTGDAMIRETAYYEEADSTETLDLYQLTLEDGCSVDFWFPKGQRPTSMDLHVVFERDSEES